MGLWANKNIKHLTTESLEKTLNMDDMELREFFGLKGSSECPKVRIALEREYAKRQAA